jgi:hypothetical protein
VVNGVAEGTGPGRDGGAGRRRAGCPRADVGAGAVANGVAEGSGSGRGGGPTAEACVFRADVGAGAVVNGAAEGIGAGRGGGAGGGGLAGG